MYNRVRPPQLPRIPQPRRLRGRHPQHRQPPGGMINTSKLSVEPRQPQSPSAGPTTQPSTPSTSAGGTSPPDPATLIEGTIGRGSTCGEEDERSPNWPTHSTWLALAALACRSDYMEGSARFTMKESRTIMNVPVISTDNGPHSPGTSELGEALAKMAPAGTRRTVTPQGWALPGGRVKAPSYCFAPSWPTWKVLAKCSGS